MCGGGGGGREEGGPRSEKLDSHRLRGSSCREQVVERSGAHLRGRGKAQGSWKVSTVHSGTPSPGPALYFCRHPWERTCFMASVATWALGTLNSLTLPLLSWAWDSTAHRLPSPSHPQAVSKHHIQHGEHTTEHWHLHAHPWPAPSSIPPSQHHQPGSES